MWSCVPFSLLLCPDPIFILNAQFWTTCKHVVQIGALPVPAKKAEDVISGLQTLSLQPPKNITSTGVRAKTHRKPALRTTDYSTGVETNSPTNWLHISIGQKENFC